MIVEQTERLEGSSERPFLEVTSKQLEAIQSEIDSQVLKQKPKARIFLATQTKCLDVINPLLSKAPLQHSTDQDKKWVRDIDLKIIEPEPRDM